MGSERFPCLARGAAWCCRALSAALLASGALAEAPPTSTNRQWIERHRHTPLESNPAAPCVGTVGGLPSLRLLEEARAPRLIRVSVPFAPAALPLDLGVVAQIGQVEVKADLRVLTTHPGTPVSVRRAILTFPVSATGAGATDIQLKLASKAAPVATTPTLSEAFTLGGNTFTFSGDSIQFSGILGTGTLSLIAPPLQDAHRPVLETIEVGEHFAWLRILLADAAWPRIIDIRIDALGGIALSGQLQSASGENGYAPTLGWRLTGLSFAETISTGETTPEEITDLSGQVRVVLPNAARLLKTALQTDADGLRYHRATPDVAVPMQPMSWRSAEIQLSPTAQPRRNALGATSTTIIDAKAYKAAYHLPTLCNLDPWQDLASLEDFTRDALTRAAAIGDDLGNLTGFSCGNAAGGAFGMNRLNHAPPLFTWGWQQGDERLPQLGLDWCINMHDLSIWWGDSPQFGGTRYNNAAAAGEQPHAGDTSFMWRTNGASVFCTKGFDAFLYAYEYSGDPRMLTALRAQVAYARANVHVNQGEARNIGDVKDFVVLFDATGDATYLDEALRLFRELRDVLSPEGLFSQGGQPIVPDPPFIDDDAKGTAHPFPKPYIIGYALAGLPRLLELCPEEPRLAEVVRAVAHFLAGTVAPSGGWRYPHAASTYTIISQGMEHAMQIANAAKALEKRGEPIEKLLDAVEVVLQARVNSYREKGTLLSGLAGWETSTGAIPEGTSIYDLYAKPNDRDQARDYTEGRVDTCSAPPEGLVYLRDVLDFYLARRPAERLFNATPELRSVLARTPENPHAPARASLATHNKQTFGVLADLPSFSQQRLSEMKTTRLPELSDHARAIYISSLQAAPPRAEFAPEVVATEDRGSYEARKVHFNLSTYARVEAYLLVPKSNGARLPAVLAMHDHGAHFSIGKEKVVRPFGVPGEVMTDAEQWVARYYGGRWFGDALAEQGFIVLAVDALFWGSRGRAEGVDFAAQQALAANLLQMGMSWSGNIVWDDLRSAEFLRSLQEVDPARIAAMGLSVGAHRSWSLAAAVPWLRAAVGVCWMSTSDSLLAPGNNQTRGQSAFSMIHPGLRSQLDYPDIAGLIAPRPLLLFAGENDGLFPLDGVEQAFNEIRAHYRNLGAESAFQSKIWPVGHEFNLEMQYAAFDWLAKSLN